MSAPRIAIPMPHSTDREYAERAIRQYEYAVRSAGAQAVRIPLDQSQPEIVKAAASCAGVLLPGSKADIEPEKFGARRSEKAAAPDPGREAIDELLLEHAYQTKKPVFGICYGLQSLNVWRGGSLIQHIPDSLPEDLRSKVNHEAGKSVAVAHRVNVDANSRLASIIRFDKSSPTPVNSSHHQSAERPGKGLRTVAYCAEDGVIEAVEGTEDGHFVLAVQWHPERSVDFDEPSRALFRAFVQAATLAVAKP